MAGLPLFLGYTAPWQEDLWLITLQLLLNKFKEKSCPGLDLGRAWLFPAAAFAAPPSAWGCYRRWP